MNEEQDIVHKWDKMRPTRIYQPVYQIGTTVHYSVDVWQKEEDAYEFLAHLRKMFGEEIHANWVNVLALN